jgi:hypothetical protein
MKARKRGRSKGDQCTPGPEQEAELQRILCEKTPDQFKLIFALWTCQAVQELVKMRTGLRRSAGLCPASLPAYLQLLFSRGVMTRVPSLAVE